MMYKVIAKSTGYYSIVVEAESIEEAIEIAEEMDGGDFDEEPKCDWEIIRAEEVEE